jgi:two-component system chemotaxis response regulator CheB
MKAMKAANGRTIAQDERSCVVYGMPKAVVEAGCADKVVPLSHMAGEIMNMV